MKISFFYGRNKWKKIHYKKYSLWRNNIYLILNNILLIESIDFFGEIKYNSESSVQNNKAIRGYNEIRSAILVINAKYELSLV